MLKASKKITKKELKHDPFLDSIYQMKEYVEDHRSMITKVVVGVAVIIIVGLVYSNNLQEKRVSSETALGNALVILNSGDKDNGVFQLQLLIDDFSGTYAAKRALFILGRINYEQKEFLTAKAYLDDFIADPIQEFQVGAYTILADLARINNDIQNIENYLNKALKHSSTKDDRDKVRIKLAEHYVNTLQYEQARVIAEDLHNSYERRSDLNNKANELLGHLLTVITDEQ